MSKSGLDVLTCCAPLSDAPMDEEQAGTVAGLLKALADPVRLRLMSLVLSHEGGEACVCDLMPAFGLSQPTISHHLKVLHGAGLLDRDKRGVWVYYRARPEAIAALASLFAPLGLVGANPVAANPVAANPVAASRTGENPVAATRASTDA